jgi:hypothetical protein
MCQFVDERRTGGPNGEILKLALPGSPRADTAALIGAQRAVVEHVEAKIDFDVSPRLGPDVRRRPGGGQTTPPGCRAFYGP